VNYRDDVGGDLLGCAMRNDRVVKLHVCSDAWRMDSASPAAAAVTAMTSCRCYTWRISSFCTSP